MQKAKAQISLRIRTLWSGPLLSANRIIGHYIHVKYQKRANPNETLRMRGMNLNLCILRMLEDTFSLEAAQLSLRSKLSYSFQKLFSFTNRQ